MILRKYGYNHIYLIPSAIVNAFYASNFKFKEFKQILNLPNYDIRIFITLKRILNKQPSKYAYGLTLNNSKTINCRKEKLEGSDENPCTAGANAIINAITQNKETLKTSNDDVSIFTSDMAAWQKKYNSAKSDCGSFANRTCTTGWTSPTVSKYTIGRKCDDNCKSSYNARYKYTGKSNFSMKRGYKYSCVISNPITVKHACINKFVANNPKPVKPSYPILVKVPDFICQNCPNTVSVSDGSDIAESVFDQANTCSISQKKTTNINTDNNTDDNIEPKDTEKPIVTKNKSSDRVKQDKKTKLQTILFYVAGVFLILFIIVLILNQRHNVSLRTKKSLKQ